jgi:hypothetical protein
MFNAIKEFFFGKPAVAQAPVVDVKVEAVNQAPYKVPEPAAPTPAPVVVEDAVKPAPTKKPAKMTASKKPAAPKKPAGAKKGGRKPKA